MIRNLGNALISTDLNATNICDYKKIPHIYNDLTINIIKHEKELVIRCHIYAVSDLMWIGSTCSGAHLNQM